MPTRLLLGLRVATSVTEIILDSKLESESESESENEKMLNTSSISMGIFPKICNNAGRSEGTVDASERSRTVHNGDFEPSGTLVHVLI
jgi:hypothetical protein